MAGWHHWLNGHEFEQAPGDRKGQGSLLRYSPWGCKELGMTEWLNNNSQSEDIGTKVRRHLSPHTENTMEKYILYWTRLWLKKKLLIHSYYCPITILQSSWKSVISSIIRACFSLGSVSLWLSALLYGFLIPASDWKAFLFHW